MVLKEGLVVLCLFSSDLTKRTMHNGRTRHQQSSHKENTQHSNI